MKEKRRDRMKKKREDDRENEERHQARRKDFSKKSLRTLKPAR